MDTQQDRQEHDYRLAISLLAVLVGALIVFMLLPSPQHMVENRRYLPGPYYALARLLNYSPGLVMAGLLGFFYGRRGGGLRRKRRAAPPDPCLPGNPLIPRFSYRIIFLPLALALMPVVYFEAACLGVFCYDLPRVLCLALIAPQWTLAAALGGFFFWQYKDWDEIDLLSLRRLRHRTFYGLHLDCYSLGGSRVSAVGMAYTWREDKQGRTKVVKPYLFFSDDSSPVELDAEGGMEQMVAQARQLADRVMVPALLDFDVELERQTSNARSVGPCELRDWKPVTGPIPPSLLPPVA